MQISHIFSVLGFYKHSGKHDSYRPDRDPLQNSGQRTINDFAGIVCLLDDRNINGNKIIQLDKNENKNDNENENQSQNSKDSMKNTDRYKK